MRPGRARDRSSGKEISMFRRIWAIVAALLLVTATIGTLTVTPPACAAPLKELIRS
jgi:hypothetical protein